MNNTPGSRVAGSTKVPAIRSLSTCISILSSRVGMGFSRQVFGQPADLIVNSLVINRRTMRYGGVFAIQLGGRGAHHVDCGVGLEELDCGDFRRAGATDAPRLLKHAGMPFPFVIESLRHVV